MLCVNYTSRPLNFNELVTFVYCGVDVIDGRGPHETKCCVYP